MAPSPSALQAVSYETESSWGENTTTFGTRLLTLNRVDTSGLTRGKESIPITRQYLNEGIDGVQTFDGGSFTIELLWTGHGGATTGSLTETDLNALLGIVLGTSDADSEGATADGAGDADAPGVNGGTFADGSICRIGDHGDGRGEGQAYAVDNLSTGTLTLFNGAGSTPNSGDNVYAMQHAYLNESTTSITSTRWQILSGNKQYECHGCFPQSITLNQLFGGVPRLSITFGVSWWTATSGNSFPDATATDAKTGAPAVLGSFAYQTHGTQTRNTLSLREFSLEIPINVQTVRGHGGANDRQIIVDAVRTSGGMPRMTVTIDAEAAGTNTLLDDYNSGNLKQLMYTVGPTDSDGDGKCRAVYMRKARMVSPVPTQRDMEGLNRISATFEGLTDTGGGSELDRSALILASG